MAATQESLVRAKKQRTAKHNKYREKKREQKKNRRGGPEVRELVVTAEEQLQQNAQQDNSSTREKSLQAVARDLPHVVRTISTAFAPTSEPSMLVNDFKSYCID